MQALLPYKPEAVFVASDTMALGALRALREAGLRAPDDIALVSHDDLPPAVQADPPLTTVQQPIARTGQLAVEKLARIIAQGGDARQEKTILAGQVSCPRKLWRGSIDMTLERREETDIADSCGQS